jgi:hypothetical protein
VWENDLDNIIQYATAVSAFGAKLAYDTSINSLDVAEYPKRKGAKKILDDALNDIKLFEDTSNFQDGLCVFALADIVDNSPNPLTETSRLNVLIQMGIMREGRFIKQILERIKTNRSWHISEVPNTCSYFGDICTNRGISDTSHRRGRKSERNPEEYHPKSSKGVGREQLVTPAIELMYDSIPQENLVSENKAKTFTLPDITAIPADDLQALIDKLQGALDAKVVSK